MQDTVKQKVNELTLGELIELIKSHTLSSEVEDHISKSIREKIRLNIAKIDNCEAPDEGDLVQDFEELLVLSEYFSKQEKMHFLESYCSNEYIRRHAISSELVRRILRHDLDASEYLADYWIAFKAKAKLLSDERSQKLFEIVDEKSNNEF